VGEEPMHQKLQPNDFILHTKGVGTRKFLIEHFTILFVPASLLSMEFNGSSGGISGLNRK
jgi:hypothetical protein